MHKIRKTYISTLIDARLNIDEIRRLAGHADERTTYSNYCFNRSTPEETMNKLEKSLNSRELFTETASIQKVINSNQSNCSVS